MANKPIKVAFASTNEYVEQAIPLPKEKAIRGYDFIAWGEDNKYPNFLYSLYENCATLQSIINGVVDYIMGDEFNVVSGNKFTDLEDKITKVCEDYIIEGIGYLNVVRNKIGGNAEVYWLDARKVRTNDKSDVFYYSEDWDKAYGKVDAIKLPAYKKDSDAPSSVICIKRGRGIYPTPLWAAAIKSVVTEIEIGKYHLNEILNNFSASAIINFNNGVPSDEDKDEIEKNVSEKFTGAENAGRFLLTFNDNKENAVTVERLSTDDYDERYSAMAKRVRSEIFTAFRANPNLFGLPTENLGFNNEEYESTFKLFNRTVIKPIQKDILKMLRKLGCEVEIKPFTMMNNDDKTVEGDE